MVSNIELLQSVVEPLSHFLIEDSVVLDLLLWQHNLYPACVFWYHTDRSYAPSSLSCFISVPRVEVIMFRSVHLRKSEFNHLRTQDVRRASLCVQRPERTYSSKKKSMFGMLPDEFFRHIQSTENLSVHLRRRCQSSQTFDTRMSRYCPLCCSRVVKASSTNNPSYDL